MRGLDFSSWQALLTTLAGVVAITLVMVGIRLLVMQTVQERRQRENRQINERLRTLIAAYKTLGGSFTGTLAVDPAHRRDLLALGPEADGLAGAERRRRIRDAVEAALSDIILLGTEEQVRLAVQAANDMAAGRPVETAEIVVSLRNFIREVLDLDPVPKELVIPRQGPLRPAPGGARGGGGRGGAAEGRGEGKGAGKADAGGGMGAGFGMGAGLGPGHAADDLPPR